MGKGQDYTTVIWRDTGHGCFIYFERSLSSWNLYETSRRGKLLYVSDVNVFEAKLILLYKHFSETNDGRFLSWEIVFQSSTS